MLTGVEIAGIILAVAPLCITILEHHEAELRPFEALLRYRKVYRRSAEDLGFCFVQLEQIMVNLFRDAGISDDGYDLKALVQAYDATVWSDTIQAKLRAHFGRTMYEQGVELKLRRIRNDVAEISSILNLKSLGTSTGDEVCLMTLLWHEFRSCIGAQEIWSRIKKAKVEQDARLSKSEPAKDLKKRAKFIFKVASLEKHLKNLGDNIREFASVSERQPSALPIRNPGPRTSRHQDPIFVPPLMDIEAYAKQLHIALQRVWACPLHNVHHVNLRLDQRLKSRNTSGHCSATDLASFTLAIGSNTDAETWHGIEVCVSEHTPITSVTRTRPTAVRFSPGPAAAGADPLGSQEQCVQDLCTLASGGIPEKELHLNESNEIVQRTYTNQPVSVQPQPRRRISFKSLLHQPRDPHLIHSLLTTEQAIGLGSVVVSAFLQLYATRWLAENWCSDNLYFFKSGDRVNIDKSYVSMSYGPTPVTSANSRQAIRDDGQFFIRLGVMLLEIWTQTTIDRLRPKDHAASNASNINSPWQDLAVIREYLKCSRDTMQPCFLKAMNYCMVAYATGIADTRDAGTRLQVIREVLRPFEEELENWRT